MYIYVVYVDAYIYMHIQIIIYIICVDPNI